MTAIGLLADSHGDLRSFDAAYELLCAQGARRFMFAGGRYDDLDEWVRFRARQAHSSITPSGVNSVDEPETPLGDAQVVDAPPELLRVQERFLRVRERGAVGGEGGDPALKAIDLIGEILCCVIHDKNDLTREDLQNANLFVHGKSALPKVVQIGPRYFITPGSVGGVGEATCGLLKLGEGGLRFSAMTLSGKALIDAQPIAVGGKTKLSVK